MTTAGITVSSVNMENRQSIGVKPGDTVRVHQKIEDKGKTRIQIFEGLVLARKHGNEAGATFTVRKVVDGIGVEKVFPLYSPMIDKIEVVRRSKVRRAKLYYIREKVAREIKRQMRRMRLVSLATESETETAARAAAEAEEAAKKAEEEAAAKAEAEAKKAEEEKAAAEAKAAESSSTDDSQKDDAADTEDKSEPETESKEEKETDSEEPKAEDKGDNK